MPARKSGDDSDVGVDTAGTRDCSERENIVYDNGDDNEDADDTTANAAGAAAEVIETSKSTGDADADTRRNSAAAEAPPPPPPPAVTQGDEGSTGASATTQENDKECENQLRRKRDLSHFVAPIRPKPNYYYRIDDEGHMRVSCDDTPETAAGGHGDGEDDAEEAPIIQQQHASAVQQQQQQQQQQQEQEQYQGGGEQPPARTIPPAAALGSAPQDRSTPSTVAPSSSSSSLSPSSSTDSRMQLRGIALASRRALVSVRAIMGTSELRELTTLAFPALAALLADPLMSLIDTACIGRLTASDLAALGCNTAVFNLVFQLFTFLSVATTSAVARRSECRDDAAPKGNCKIVSAAMCIAVVLGLTATVVLQISAAPLLRFMGADAELVALGLPYMRIRALAVPAVLVNCCAHGAFLGVQDARTPLAVFLVVAALNAVGDILLVLPPSFLGIPSMGLAGAATATLFAQLIASAFFVVALVRRNLLPSRLRDVRLPSRDDVLGLMDVSGMLLLGSVCRMGVYTMMTTTATSMGVLVSATHQIALQIFWTLTYFVDPLFVAATSLIARDVVHRPAAVHRMISILLSFSSVAGFFVGVLSGALAVGFPDVFTADAEVAAMLSHIAPLMVLSQVFSAMVLVAEGVLIGLGDLGYLLRVHCANFFMLAVYLALVYRFGGGIAGVWGGVMLNQLLRLLQHGYRMSSAKDELVFRTNSP